MCVYCVGARCDSPDPERLLKETGDPSQVTRCFPDIAVEGRSPGSDQGSMLCSAI